MTELIHFSKVMAEDLDLGDGTREVRLADGSLHTLHRIAGHVAIPRTFIVTATAATSTLSIPGAILAGARVHGVTVKNLSTLGNSNGLSSYDVGDAVFTDRWGNGVGITANIETSQLDFTDDSEPIYRSATAVVLTGNANFDGTGEIEVTIHYSMLRHRSA